MKNFFKDIFDLQYKIKKLLREENKPMNALTEEDFEKMRSTTKCYICGIDYDEKIISKLSKFDIKNKKNVIKGLVYDHCHKSGNFRGIVHNSCNLNFNIKGYKIPVFFHNFVGYDSHFIIDYFMKLNIAQEYEKGIDVIPLNTEKYLTMTIGYLKFIDSFGFLVSSLDVCVKSLNKPDFIHTNEYFKDKTDL